MKKNKLALFLPPYVLWMAVFVVIPILMIVVYAFSSAGAASHWRTLPGSATTWWCSPALSSWPSSPPPSACCWATPSSCFLAREGPVPAGGHDAHHAAHSG